MLLNEIIEIIQYHLSKKMILKIERRNISGNEIIIGFPIKLSKKYMLMTVVNDFHDEGFAVIKVDDITDAYSNETDAFYEKICISEGLQDKSTPIFIEDISDIEKILTQLKNYEGFISIQCEKQIEKCTFYIGKIIEIKDNYVIFKDLDMNGKWDEEFNKIPFDEVTQITFGDNYSKMFYKYVTQEDGSLVRKFVN